MAGSGSLPKVDRLSVMKELEENGYVVIPEVCSAQDCDTYISQYKEWLDQFTDDEWPYQMQSIIQGYRIGHFENTWHARLKAKPVFAKVWETEKLLTSYDGVAISPPPENEETPVYSTGSKWFHLDQASRRSGLHAYQGALYLEESSATDYCFRVLSGSHKYFEELYDRNEAARRRSNYSDFYKLSGDEIEWMKEKGCVETKVPVPKGGMALWDSRTVHDNVKPERGRPNSDRWRFVVFVCMTPAKWATLSDMDTRKRATQKLMMTAHWPSQEVNLFSDYSPFDFPNIKIPKKLPDVAMTDEAQLLAGVKEYDFEDGEPNGPDWEPCWKDEK